jgi:MFS family permease
MGNGTEKLFSRDFILLSALTFLTFFAAFQLFPTAPLRLLTLGASVAESGRFLAAFTAGSSLGALVTGPLGDRIGQRRMVVGCALGFALFMGAYGAATTRWPFYALAFPHGVVWSGLLTATMASLGRTLPPSRRADGMSIYGLASPGGIMLGPLVGTTIYHLWGFTTVTWGMGALFTLLSLMALSLPPDGPRPPRERLRLPEGAVVVPCLIFFATALGYGALGTYTVQEADALHFPRLLGALSSDSAFLSCMAIGMVAMRIVMGRRGFGRNPNRLLPAMMVMSIAGLGLLALMPGGLTRHILSALVYGSGYSMIHTLLNAHVLEVTHADRRGAAFGATLFSFDSGIGVGSLLVGLVMGHAVARYGPAGFRAGWGAATLAALAALPLALRMVRGHREPA